MNKREKEFFASLKDKGIRPEIIDAYKKFDQKDFFDPIFSDYFYSDEPIPIGNKEKADGSALSAIMINYLPSDKKSRILEIGTGSGYSTAILSALYSEVITVEYHESLAMSAKEKLSKLKVNNVRFLAGDIMELEGIPGLFDGIIIFAACSRRPLFLMPHLKNKGCLIFPMGPIFQQQITLMENEPGENGLMYKVSFYDYCVFTPMAGM